MGSLREVGDCPAVLGNDLFPNLGNVRILTRLCHKRLGGRRSGGRTQLLGVRIPEKVAGLEIHTHGHLLSSFSDFNV